MQSAQQQEIIRDESPQRQSIRRTNEDAGRRESQRQQIVSPRDIQLDEEQVSADAPEKKMSQAQPAGPGASQIGGLGRNQQFGQ